MNYNRCVTSLNLNGKIPARELKDTAAAYQAQGMSADAAMIRAVEDKLELMQMEERKITKAVRDAYEAQGGKKRKQKTQKAEAKPATEKPQPVAPTQGEKNASTEETSPREEAGQAKQAPAEADVLTPEKPARGNKAKGEPAMSVAGDDITRAIERLMADKAGEATVNVPGLGDVTIPYGDDKAGLAHIAKRRGADFIQRLPELLTSGNVYEKGKQPGRVFVGNESDEAVISLTRDSEKQPWLLSAYERYPDLKASSVSDLDDDRMPEGKFFTKDDLRKSLTSNGVLGQVIASMIDSGIVVLHGGPSKLPGGAGRRIKGLKAVTRPDGTIHMVASNLTPRTALPVMLHEMFHQGGEKLIGGKEWGNLMGRLGSLYRQSEQSSGKAREFYDRARARVAAARRKGAVGRAMEVEEFAAYAIEEYEKDPRSLPAAIRKWVEDLLGVIKTWMVKNYGKQIGAVTPAQLAAMARWALMDVAVEKRGEIFGPLGEVFSSGTDQTDTPAFQRWFGDSKVVDKNGAPLVVYHGTTGDFSQFDTAKAGAATGHRSADMGIFLTADAGIASQFAGERVDDTTWPIRMTHKSGGNVVPAYLSVKNPLVITARDFASRFVRGAESASKFRNQAIQDGHDGILIKGDVSLGEQFGGDEYAADAWVVFRPEQIKSAIGNSGAFDPDNADIRYSVADDEQVDEVAKAIDRRPLDIAIEGGLAKLKKDGILPSVPMNYLVDFARQNMTAVKEYMSIKRAMDAYRGEKHAQYDAHAQRWLKFNAKHKADAQKLADLMHDSTIAQVDPSRPYQPGVTLEDEATLEMEPNSKAAELIRAKQEAEPARREAYKDLKARYDALPEEGKALYKETRDQYKAQAAELDQIILANVERTMRQSREQAKDRYDARVARAKENLVGKELADELALAQADYAKKTGLAKYRDRARMVDLRKMFESNRLAGPYFPLARFGDYFVSVRDAEGDVVSFSKFEGLAAAQKYAAEAKKQFPDATVDIGLMSNRKEVRGAIDPQFLTDIENILSGSDVPPDVQDEIWQRYLQTMPDLSMRKRFIHRKGTAGFSRDALRAYASAMFHGSHQMGRLKFGPELQDTLDTMRKQAKEADKPIDATMLVNEFEQRHKWVMNPQGGSFAQALSSLAFIWNLAATPAAAIVNTSQTFMMGVPVLGSRLGGQAKAAAALARASKQLVTSKKWHIENNPRLTGKEQEALREFYRLGLIDRTQSHDLAGVGETGVEYNALRAKVMQKISFLYHNAERVNREVTALAAYRMARDQGQSHERAIETAADLTWVTHFDYSNSNRARIIQNDAAKIFLIHRQHSINMTYRLFRDIQQAFKGDSAQARKEARSQFIGIMAMHGLMAGIKGLPFYGIALIAAGMMSGWGDDDDKLTPEDRLKKALYDTAPKWLADALMYGAPSTGSGLSITGRVGFPDLFFRSPDKELEGKEEAMHYVNQVLGAGVGLPVKMYGGLDLMRQGHLERGAEQMLPKALADLVKTNRYRREGVLNMRGNPVVDQLNAWELIGQAAGFTPHRVTQQYDVNEAKRKLQAAILNERATLINKAYLADKMDDGEAYEEALAKLDKFNDRHPDVAVKNLGRSIKARRKSDERAVGGVILDKRLEESIGESLGLEVEE